MGLISVLCFLLARTLTQQELTLINSRYIREIMELAFKDSPDRLALYNQLPFIEEKDFEFTGGGVFVDFKHLDGIEKYKDTEYVKDMIVGVVSIESPEVTIGADATISVVNGFIDYLEIWCFEGDYPKEDLKKYVLTKEW